MATLILRSTHSLLEKKMKDLDQQKKRYCCSNQRSGKSWRSQRKRRISCCQRRTKYDCAKNTNFTNTFTVSNR